jgi:DNA invertase Pin-like site-specific DNA recombinase
MVVRIYHGAMTPLASSSPAPFRAVIYVRISQDRTGASLGVKRQEEDCRDLATRLGWTVAEDDVFIDNDASAYSGKPRRDYLRMLAVLETGQVQGVLIWHTDRLHRSPLELEGYVELAERKNIITQSVKVGKIDLSTPSGRMVARILGAVAREEVEHKADRTRRAQQQAAAAGRWLGGTRPFGWVFDGTTAHLDPVEAPLIVSACREIINGASLASVFRTWNDAGVMTSYGNRWNYANVRQVLIRARNAGISTWLGETVGTSVFPAIVSEDTWQAVTVILNNPARRTSPGNNFRWLLSGIARCPCGAVVHSATNVKNGVKRPIYRCSAATKGSTGHVSKGAVITDKYVRAIVKGILTQQKLPSGAEPESGAFADAAALRGRLDDAAESYGEGRITLAQMEKITARVNASLAEVEARIAVQMRSEFVATYGGEDGAKRWLAAPIERQRDVLRSLVAVTLLHPVPGSRSEPSTETVRRPGRPFDYSLIQVLPLGEEQPVALTGSALSAAML